MNIQSNSAKSLHQELLTGRINERSRRILARAGQADHPWTDRQMRQWLGYGDMNAVRPRITELTQLGYLVTVGTTRDDVTGKQVRLTRAATTGELRAARQRHAQPQTATQTYLSI